MRQSLAQSNNNEASVPIEDYQTVLEENKKLQSRNQELEDQAAEFKEKM